MASDSKNKPNVFKRFFSSIGNFFKGMSTELKKVTWPTKRQVLVNTLSVLAFCLFVGIIIWLCDAGLQALATLIESLK